MMSADKNILDFYKAQSHDAKSTENKTKKDNRKMVILTQKNKDTLFVVMSLMMIKVYELI